MIRIKSITIPKPCDQQWEQMNTVNGGRQCESCCKTVIDFTSMTNNEIVAHLAVKGNVCGRFNVDQPARLNRSLKPSGSGNKLWKKLRIVAFIAGLFSSIKADAQIKTRAPFHHLKVLNTHKGCPKHSTVSDTLYCKTLTPDQISIDTNIKFGDPTHLALKLNEQILSNVIGGIQVKGITVDDSRNSFYISLRELFKY
jgi:hypothetical protein